MLTPKTETITEEDLQEAIPGCKAYWNVYAPNVSISPFGRHGGCQTDFFHEGKRYRCESLWEGCRVHHATAVCGGGLQTVMSRCQP